MAVLFEVVKQIDQQVVTIVAVLIKFDLNQYQLKKSLD